MFDLIAMAQAPQNAGGSPPNALLMNLPFFIIILVFIIFIIVPQWRKQKEVREMLKNLAKGDKVLTSGGIIGTVVGVEDDKITIKTSTDSTKLEIARDFIAQKLIDKPTQ